MHLEEDISRRCCHHPPFAKIKLTHPSIVLTTSESMPLANRTDPSSPSNGINRVLLFPGIGHLATTTIDPFTLLLWSIESLGLMYVEIWARITGLKLSIWNEEGLDPLHVTSKTLSHGSTNRLLRIHQWISTDPWTKHTDFGHNPHQHNPHNSESQQFKRQQRINHGSTNSFDGSTNSFDGSTNSLTDPPTHWRIHQLILIGSANSFTRIHQLIYRSVNSFTRIRQLILQGSANSFYKDLPTHFWLTHHLADSHKLTQLLILHPTTKATKSSFSEFIFLLINSKLEIWKASDKILDFLNLNFQFAPWPPTPTPRRELQMGRRWEKARPPCWIPLTVSLPT